MTAQAEPSGRAARLGPFRHRPFAIYWAGGLLSNLGTWLQAVAGSIFVYQLTGSALAVGLLNFAGFLPILLFSVAGGVISDRYDRRSIVIWTHAASLVLASGLAALAFAGQATELHLVAVAFALNTAYAIAKPSIISILPGLVPRDEITDAVGLNSLQFILGQVIGPTVAAVVLATAGAQWAFTINALTFLGPILSMVYLARRGLGGRAAGRPSFSTVETPPIGAVAYIRDQTWVVALLAGVVACSAPLEIIRTLSPALVVEGLHQPDSTAGLIVAAQGIGSALALIVFIPLRKRGVSRQTAAFGLVLQALGIAGAALAGSLAAAAVSVGLIGFGFSLCFPVLTGILQAEVPDDVRGRIMSVHQMAHLGNRPFTALLVGSLAAIVGAQSAIMGGLVLVPIGLVSTRAAWRRMSGTTGRSTASRNRSGLPSEAGMDRPADVATGPATPP